MNKNTTFLKKFQFLKGAIKSIGQITIMEHMKHFNSLKVRLKDGTDYLFGIFDLYFNSLKVRLKVTCNSNILIRCDISIP